MREFNSIFINFLVVHSYLALRSTSLDKEMLSICQQYHVIRNFRMCTAIFDAFFFQTEDVN